MKIKNVIICGLGALGLTYANKLRNICNLKILANEERILNYKENTPVLNNQKIILDYIKPSETWKADLIIIATKSNGLDSAIAYIKNFVSENTIIISLINGISSEEKISLAYPSAKVLRSYFIGHSAIRDKNQTVQDGVGKIVIEKEPILEEFFIENKIDFEIADDIVYSQWLKLGVNIVLNELTAIYKCTVGELRKRDDYLLWANKLLKEVCEVAQAHGIKNLDNYINNVLESANLIADDGKTSMYQDILAKRHTEVEIFSGEIIRLGIKYGIKTLNNMEIYNRIKEIERAY